MMLDFLETGKALYVLAAVCALGLLTRLMARNSYKRLIRETDNMTLTKNRYLRELKQKAENAYRLNQGIQNTQAYLEKQLTSYHFLGLSLNGWGNLSSQFTVLCFLCGGIAAFASYWYRCDNYYIVLYGTVGILTGLLTLFVDCGVNLSEKRAQLLNALQDYMENSLFHRLARENASVMEDSGRESASRERGNRDSNIRELNIHDLNIKDLSSRSGQEEETPSRDGIRSISQRERSKIDRTRNGSSAVMDGRMEEEKQERQVKKSTRVARKAQQEETVSPMGQNKGAQGKDMDYPKRSLEQIAASREKDQGEGDWIKDLSSDELELVGEILKQYLS